MRFFSHRIRIWLFVVIAFLASVVVMIGVTRIVNPGFNLMEAVGLGDGEEFIASKTKPYWTELTDKQRSALVPLEKCWDKISVPRKKKWLQIAKRMEQMSSEERARLQERIQIWVNLTPQERKEARQNYLNAKKLGIKDKSLQWLEYQNLPEQEKRKFVAKARKKRRIPEPKVEKIEEVQVIKPQPVEEKIPVKEEIPEYWR